MTIFQCGFRGETPTAIFIHHRATNRYAIVPDLDRLPGLTGTTELRLVIVGDATVHDQALVDTDIIGEVADLRRGRQY